MADTPNPLPTLRISRGPDDALCLEIAGRLDSFLVRDVWNRARRAIRKARAPRVTVDASGVTYCDSSGATMLTDLRAVQQASQGSFELIDFPINFAPVLDLLRQRTANKRECPPTQSWPEAVGQAAVAVCRDCAALVGDIGEIFAALVYCALHPTRVRWGEMLQAAQSAGVNSTPVVLLVSGLLGLIMGFQSAQTLHNYGGDLLLADLIGISFLRELGPLMTAIILSARSGSAFAAELGTMKIGEEVDALRTMGADPVRFLVAPRVIAAILMTPLLTVFADLAGLTGGFMVWVWTLDLSFPAYLAQLDGALQSPDLYTGLLKSVVFGTLVAGVGCIRGMQTRGSASAVGRSTTSAVVSGIVLIAMSDSMFTVVFHFLKI